MNKMLDTRNDVENFMIAGDQTLVGYTEQSDLYINLITEELIHELLKEYDRKNLVGIADGIADSIVVIEGFCHSLGIDIKDIWKHTKFYYRFLAKDKIDKESCVYGLLHSYSLLRENYKNSRDPKYIFPHVVNLLKTLLILSDLFELPLQEIWDEVIRSNNSKILENGKIIKNEFGKIQKPSTFSPADISSILIKYKLIENEQ